MRKNVGEDQLCGFRDMRADRQSDVMITIATIFRVYFGDTQLCNCLTAAGHYEVGTLGLLHLLQWV